MNKLGWEGHCDMQPTTDYWLATLNERLDVDYSVTWWQIKTRLNKDSQVKKRNESPVLSETVNYPLVQIYWFF